MTALSLIVARAKNNVIGLNNTLPWHLPEDLKRFRALTTGHHIIMGRKTWQSLGRALPNRRNIVVSSSTTDSVPNIEVRPTPEAAMELVANSPEVVIIGGAQLYHYFLPQTQRMYLTFIDAQLVGDTFFPSFDTKNWYLAEEQHFVADQKNPYNYSFTIYERL